MMNLLGDYSSDEAIDSPLQKMSSLPQKNASSTSFNSSMEKPIQTSLKAFDRGTGSSSAQTNQFLTDRITTKGSTTGVTNEGSDEFKRRLNHHDHHEHGHKSEESDVTNSSSQNKKTDMNDLYDPEVDMDLESGSGSDSGSGSPIISESQAKPDALTSQSHHDHRGSSNSHNQRTERDSRGHHERRHHEHRSHREKSSTAQGSDPAQSRSRSRSHSKEPHFSSKDRDRSGNDAPVRDRERSNREPDIEAKDQRPEAGRERDRDQGRGTSNRAREDRRDRDRERRTEEEEGRDRDRNRRGRKHSPIPERRYHSHSRSRSDSQSDSDSDLRGGGGRVVCHVVGNKRGVAEKKPRRFEGKRPLPYDRPSPSPPPEMKALKSTESIPSTITSTPSNLSEAIERAKKHANAQLHKMGSSATAGGVTPLMALGMAMQPIVQQVEAQTGVSIPKFYNPAAVNPAKYAEIAQKRKLLWGKKESADEQKQEVKKTWTGMAVAAGAGSTTAGDKFRKLLGLKEGDLDRAGPGDSGDVNGEAMQRRQQELFAQLEHEYNFARMATHTHSHQGLGAFTSAATSAPVEAANGLGPAAVSATNPAVISAPPQSSLGALRSSFLPESRGRT